MSSNKVLAAVLITLLIVVAFGVFSTAAGKRRKPEESSAESIESVASTDPAFVPSVMPTRISLQIPAGFTATSSEAYDIYYVCRDASIIVTGESIAIVGEQVEHYAENMLAQYSRTADNFQLVKQEQFAVNGVQCVQMQFRYDIVAPDAKQTMECVTAVMLKDNRSYIITCKSHGETFPGYLESFRAAIRSAVIADEVQVPLTSASESAQTGTTLMTVAQP